jgi:DNA-binding GntR family transcriptional regulator
LIVGTGYALRASFAEVTRIVSVIPDAPALDLPGDRAVADDAARTRSALPSRSAATRHSRGAFRQQPLNRLVGALRQDLADGAYSPHERLVEADLVERYGAARAAVREALIQLASEGLVERAPHRGARVRGMSLAEAIETAEVRRALESIAVARAAERATPAERQAILALAHALADAARADDVGIYLRLNARFHRSIHAMARHSTAQAILAQFQHRPIDRFFPDPFRPVPPTASVEAHLRIAAAIEAGDPAQAEAAMHEHLTDLIDVLRRFERGSASGAAT